MDIGLKIIIAGWILHALILWAYLTYISIRFIQFMFAEEYNMHDRVTAILSLPPETFTNENLKSEH